jgi:anti-sigma regulatory factor (Ser/Thr protein kinase)
MSTHTHAVSFYDEDTELTDGIGRFVADGLADGESVVVIATPQHRQAIDELLAEQGIDPARVRADGCYAALDASQTLDVFMADDGPDADRFHAFMGGVLDHARATGVGVRAFGEMVALLWERGDVAAAITLESLWNDLAEQHQFSLRCAYPTFALDPADLGDVGRVCAMHSAVLPPHRYASPSGTTGTGDDARRSEIFVPAPGAVTAVRRFVSTVLESWGHEELVWDACVVASELATNAVRHGNSPFRASIERASGVVRGGVRISVEDVDPGVPERRAAALDDVDGRGIAIVEELSDRWGFEPLGAGKVTWAELDAPGTAR